ncbi:MAG TPA: anti-sigma factor [Rhodopila sp.]
MTVPDDMTLMAFADGELDQATARDVSEFIARDLDAQDKVRQFQQSADLVRAVFAQPHFRQPSPVRRKVRRSPVAFAPFSRPRYSLIAASLALFLVGMGAGAGVILVNPGPSFSERLLDEVADYHTLYAREAEHQVEVPANRLAHIETWLGNRLHRPLAVPDLSARGLTFVGARLLSVDGAPVAQLLYHAPGREHQPVALCIAADKTPDAAVRGEEYSGVHEVTWSRGGYSYVIAGWETNDFLVSLAAELEPKFELSL